MDQLALPLFVFSLCVVFFAVPWSTEVAVFVAVD